MLAAYLKTATGAALDLTNATSARLVAVQQDVNPAPAALTRTLTIATPRTDGKVTYTFLSADWSGGTKFEIGRYRWEVEITWSGGGIQTVPTRGGLTLVVEDDLD